MKKSLLIVAIMFFLYGIVNNAREVFSLLKKPTSSREMIAEVSVGPGSDVDEVMKNLKRQAEQSSRNQSLLRAKAIYHSDYDINEMIEWSIDFYARNLTLIIGEETKIYFTENEIKDVDLLKDEYALCLVYKKENGLRYLEKIVPNKKMFDLFNQMIGADPIYKEIEATLGALKSFNRKDYEGIVKFYNGTRLSFEQVSSIGSFSGAGIFLNSLKLMIAKWRGQDVSKEVLRHREYKRNTISVYMPYFYYKDGIKILKGFLLVVLFCFAVLSCIVNFFASASLLAVLREDLYKNELKIGIFRKIKFLLRHFFLLFFPYNNEKIRIIVSDFCEKQK